MLLSLLLAIGTLFLVVSHNEAYSTETFWNYAATISPLFLLLALVSAIGVLFSEAAAVLHIIKGFGYGEKIPVRNGVLYAASDIYFSAITPSATGGQPASALFMIRDGIPAAVTTVALLLNLILYTASILLIGLLCFLLYPSLFLQFSPLSKLLIAVGALLQIGLILLFLLFIFKESIVYRLCEKGLKLLHKLRLVKNVEEKLSRLRETTKDYQACAACIRQKPKILLGGFFYNLLQRMAFLLVPVFLFLAEGGSASNLLRVWVTQGYIVLGSNSIPIPGAMGVADYLVLDGFRSLLPDPVSFDLFTRGISFYFLAILCAILTLIGYLAWQIRSSKAVRERSEEAVRKSYTDSKRKPPQA